MMGVVVFTVQQLALERKMYLTDPGRNVHEQGHV